MIRAWCDQIRFNKRREYIPRGFRLLHDKGIIEWDGKFWRLRKADEVSILSIGKVRVIE